MGLDDLLKNQLGHGPKFQKFHIHSLSNTGRRNWAYFHSMGSGFRDNGCFSKLPNFWPRNLTIGQNSRSGRYTLFLTQGLEIELIFALRAAVSEVLADFQNFHIWAGIPEVAHTLSFSPREPKLSLFLLYGQHFPRYGPIFKLAIFWHETWQVTKVPEVEHVCSFYTRGQSWG